MIAAPMDDRGPTISLRTQPAQLDKPRFELEWLLPLEPGLPTADVAAVVAVAKAGNVTLRVVSTADPQSTALLRALR
jgi:hypothetical protein